MSRIRRALLRVSDKTGLPEFAAGLVEMGIELISTGGTARVLRDAGLTVRDVSEMTGVLELMDGRVRMLHPKILGALLARRDRLAYLEACAAHGIELIDLVVVNLYPFQQTVAKSGVTLAEAIEQIDIGGPTLLRAAAKNHRDVTVICNPRKYNFVLEEMRANGGWTLPQTRLNLAKEVFRTVAIYDLAIANYFAEIGLVSPNDNPGETDEPAHPVVTDPDGWVDPFRSLGIAPT